MLVERRNIFHNSLLQIVKDQHREFLASLHPPIQVRDGFKEPRNRFRQPM
jgi:hypothetical protein